MKRIALIAPCILPVPAIKGGAVEELITRLIDYNEVNNHFEIDLFTCDGGKLEKAYIHTYMCLVREDKVLYIQNRLSDKFYRTIGTISSKRFLDDKILLTFKNRLNELDRPYDAVVVQNMMSTAVKIVDFCQGKYEFPIYFHMHNDVDVYRSPQYIRHLVQNGVQFIAVSEYIKNQILKYDDGALVHVLYNGVDLDSFNFSKPLQDEVVNFLYAGRIIPGKGVLELVKAFLDFQEGLNESEKDKFSLTVVGFSGLDKRYERQIRKMTAGKKQIKLVARVMSSEVASMYGEADVIVMPTKDEEPFGLVALESLAVGRALITTNSGAIPEVVGDAAIIVDKNDNFEDNLCCAIAELAFDPELRLQLSQKAYNRAREVDAFKIEQFCDGFYKILDGREFKGKISVIVPVYNVADYLKDCIESLINQTYEDLEILLINDGSTDNSLEICEEYASKDKRIRVITQSNQGLSGARNTGLDAATGMYVFLCDSDDYIRKDTLETLLKKLVFDNADIVACGFASVWCDNNRKTIKEEAFTSSNPGIWSGKEALKQMMTTNNVCTVAWNKLYKSALWKGVRFTPGILHEDEALTYKLLYNAKLLSYTPVTYYKYRQRSDSIMKNDIGERYLFFVKALEERISFFHENGENALAQYSVVSLLEQLKYAYRCVESVDEKAEIAKLYNNELEHYGAPKALGIRKKLALIGWKYIKY